MLRGKVGALCHASVVVHVDIDPYNLSGRTLYGIEKQIIDPTKIPQ